MNSVYYFKDIEPSIYRHRGIVEFSILETTVSRGRFKNYLKNISDELGMKPHPEQSEPIITSASGHTLQKHNGLEAMLFWLESGMHAYYWELPQLITLDMHSCAYLDKEIVERVTRNYFTVIDFIYMDLVPMDTKADSKKIEVRNHDRYGKGLFATEFIHKDEFIAGFYGEIYEAENALSVPEMVVNHVIQFGNNKFRAANGLAKLTNHSCEPNCGISGLFDIVAMKDINTGEELFWDYAMTENSNWQVPGGKCLCGSSICRGEILPYRDLPEEFKEKYRDYTSVWLLQETPKL